MQRLASRLKNPSIVFADLSCPEVEIVQLFPREGEIVTMKETGLTMLLLSKMPIWELIWAAARICP
jgi:hypothetical protein